MKLGFLLTGPDGCCALALRVNPIQYYQRGEEAGGKDTDDEVRRAAGVLGVGAAAREEALKKGWRRETAVGASADRQPSHTSAQCLLWSLRAQV